MFPPEDAPLFAPVLLKLLDRGESVFFYGKKGMMRIFEWKPDGQLPPNGINLACGEPGLDVSRPHISFKPEDEDNYDLYSIEPRRWLLESKRGF